VIANPFLAAAQLLARMRMRAIRAYERTPSLSERIRAALSGAVLAPPSAPAA
jgi:hypothetical protein